MGTVAPLTGNVFWPETLLLVLVSTCGRRVSRSGERLEIDSLDQIGGRRSRVGAHGHRKIFGVVVALSCRSR